MNKKHHYPGRLIAVEGLDGSGKSTQVYLLKRWMEMQGMKVFFTEWNSSALVKDATRKGKKRQLLTPTTFSLVHATDFADRFERQILPLLRAGYIVLADRYMYTAFGRDIVRGCDPRWVRNLYSFAVVPDIAFFFDTPLEVSLGRILGGRPQLKYFEAGMDLNLADNEVDSFKIFQGRIYAEYKKMVDTEGFVVMDGMLPVEKQQAMVRKYVEQQIDLPSFRWKGKQ
ncbi:MAG: thymidylate kinase [Verrucomicrobia bacterium]|nr:thymidylate kinase [Verrucomicrobiota bacterium]